MGIEHFRWWSSTHFRRQYSSDISEANREYNNVIVIPLTRKYKSFKSEGAGIVEAGDLHRKVKDLEYESYRVLYSYQYNVSEQPLTVTQSPLLIFVLILILIAVILFVS